MKEPIGHTAEYPPTHDSELIKEEKLPLFIQEQLHPGYEKPEEHKEVPMEDEGHKDPLERDLYQELVERYRHSQEPE